MFLLLILCNSFECMDRFTGYKKCHNGSVEYFKPFNGTMVTSAQFIPLNILQKISKCFSHYLPQAYVKQIVVACSHDGQIKIFYQIIELK
jgi:hypothetical protein